MKSILDPTFKYTNSASTDIRKTFARVRREMKAEKQQDQNKIKTLGDILRRAQERNVG